MFENRENIIEVRGLAKRFGEVQAVAGVDFDVRQGELFGFLGPNGAGKTTTINMLTGLARPDAGTIRIAGIDCYGQSQGGPAPDGRRAGRKQPLSRADRLRQPLLLRGALRHAQARSRKPGRGSCWSSFGLAEAADRKFGGYSKGMKRKLTIAAGIIHDPPILFLDEPTTGIDVASARQIRQLIADLNRAGTTIFLTTHYIEEAERLCGRIAFIVNGRIVRIDTVDNLMQPIRGPAMWCSSPSTGTPTPLCRASSPKHFPTWNARPWRDAAIRVESAEPVRVGPLVRLPGGTGWRGDRGPQDPAVAGGRLCPDHRHRSATAMTQREGRRQEAAHETLDRLLEHSAQGHADLLPQAAEHQLGPDLSAGLDRDVLHQVRRRPAKSVPSCCRA